MTLRRNAALLVMPLALGLLPAPAVNAFSAPAPAVVDDDGTVAADPAATADAPHIVRVVDPPLASYRGGIAGLAPTSPETLGDTLLDVDSAASAAYLLHLKTLQDAVLVQMTSLLGRTVEAEHRYSYAYNGIAVQLTAREARLVEGLDAVAAVSAPIVRTVLSDAGPEWIGAPAIWDGSATPTAEGSQGEGVVVGVIDTGINFDHPSFAATGVDGYVHSNPRRSFVGLCDPLTGAPFCNSKLIGVWDFTGSGGEDAHGHGSHTASTAAGNVVDATVSAPTITLERTVSGVAPHANIISYKGCTPAGTCLSPSLVAAIDQATADGVDVINYSIGGTSSNPWADDDSLAFLGAREAGVFVATSAGNSGPGEATLGSPADAPWLLAVGAATHDRAFINSVADMSGGATAAPGDLVGRSLTSAYGPAGIVHAADFGDGQCLNPFPPGTFAGQIVICERGTIARIDKGSNVQAGGAGGLVLINLEVDGESTVADPHVLPAVQLGYADGAALTAWVRDGGSGHTASISGTVADQQDSNGDVLAGFSSRGHNPSVPGVVKPDIVAPGVDILAAYHTVDPLAAPEFGLMSGTSMSSPHAAGAAALVRAVHPDWTPSQVQSAMMATSLDDVVRDSDGVTPAGPFGEGAGRVDLTAAARAALTLDASNESMRAADPAAGGDPSTLNLPSLGEDDCSGTCTWQRVIGNPTGQSLTWRASASGDVPVTISPRRFTVGPGQEVVVRFTADVAGMTVGEWAFGAVDFTPQGGPSAVPASHFPVAVLPSGAGDAEIAITTDQAQGNHVETMTSPIAVQDLQVQVGGLQQGVIEQLTIPQDPTMLDPYDIPLGTSTVLVDVPEGAVALTAEITATTASDLDLFVGLDANGDGVPQLAEEVCSSASATALESCMLTELEPGRHWVMVQNWLTGQVVDDVSLSVAVVPGTNAGNLTVTGPSRVAANTPFDLTFGWSLPELAAGDAWFGIVTLGSDRQSFDDVGRFLVSLRHP